MEFKDEYKLYEAILEGKELHGHTKIELTDVNTGKTEVHESDNIVTNAVRNILRDNYSGTLELSKAMPLRDLFGGVYCFGNTNTANVDNIIPPNDEENTLIAHAGQTSHGTASPLRGNPNGLESGEITGGYKFVWDFSTSQGNGTISSLSLTHKNFGDIGLKPFDANLKAVVDMTDGTQCVKVASDSFTRAMSIRNPRKFDTDTGEATSVYISGTTFEEIVSSFSTTKIYLNDTFMTPREKSSRTATLTRSFNLSQSAVVEDDTNYYVVEIPTNGSTQVYMNTINKTTFAVTNSSFTATGCSLYQSQVSNNLLACFQSHPLIACDGTYLYLPSTSYTLYRINLSNLADITALESNKTSWLGLAFSEIRTGIVAIAEKMLIGFDFFVNGDKLYNVARTTTNNTSYYPFATFTRGNYPNALLKGQPVSTNGSYNIVNGVYMLPYLATINNLDSAVTKSSNQTMKITYSITES